LIIPRGKKSCESCGVQVGPRTKVCKCGFQFTFTPKFLRPEHGKEVDWHDLKPKDIIKVVQNTGPVWTTIDNEEINMGYSGTFEVHHIDHEYIHAIPKGRNNDSGRCLIYMGLEKQTKVGTLLRPHKIVKLKNKD
jgi:hypothetical protein